MDTTNIDYYLFEDGRVSGKRYKEREAFWLNTSLWRSGYVPDHNQVYFKLMLYKNDQASYDRTIEDVKAVLPFLKDNKGVKRFGIFEHTLSEGGIYALDCYEDKFVLTFCRYGRKSELHNFEKLEEAIRYIQENHYYENLLEDED